MNEDSEFLVNPRILEVGIFVTDLSLSRVFLMNDSRFPWIVLVPRQANLEEIYDLSQKDQEILLAETMTIARLMKSLFNADKMNIGAIGNKVRQLHMHIVARKENDAAWPEPVWGWGCKTVTAYSELELDSLVQKLRIAIK